MPAQGRVDAGQVGHARKRLKVIGAELGFLERERVSLELEGLRVTAEEIVAGGKVIHARERVGGGRGRA